MPFRPFSISFVKITSIYLLLVPYLFRLLSFSRLFTVPSVPSIVFPSSSTSNTITFLSIVISIVVSNCLFPTHFVSSLCTPALPTLHSLILAPYILFAIASSIPVSCLRLSFMHCKAATFSSNLFTFLLSICLIILIYCIDFFPRLMMINLPVAFTLI